MATKPTPKATVIQFRTRDRVADEEELPVGLPPSSLAKLAPAPSASAIDLSDKPKIWFVIGPGRSGKTMPLSLLSARSLTGSAHAGLRDGSTPEACNLALLSVACRSRALARRRRRG
jgi:hypothetical protein